MALKIYFGSLAVDMIQQSGREIQLVAEAIGKTPASQFTKWKAGRWTYIAENKLLRIIDEIAGRDRSKRASLMVAYLIDMTPEVLRPLLSVTATAGDTPEDTGLTGRWSPSLREKLMEIGAAYARDDDFMRMADQLGKWAVTINKRAAEKKG